MGLKRSVLPPLCVLLLHLGACSEAVEWAGKRPISKATLLQCDRSDWRAWIMESLGVSRSAKFPELKAAALKALSGNGNGYGYGYGIGSGSGNGSGNGYGDGCGDGSGDGYGYGIGSGYGNRSDLVVRT